MNIISYNIRGLGRGVKWIAIRRLVTKHQTDMLCIQETKREQIDKAICQALWGDTDLSWKYSRQQIQLADCCVYGMRRYLKWRGGSLVGASFYWRVCGLKRCKKYSL